MDNNNEELNGYNEEEDSVVILKDEDGNDVKFEFLDLIEYEGENYLLLLPAEEVEDENADEVVILKEDPNSQEDEEAYISVEDEDTLNKIFEIFKEKFKEEFNFIDE